MMRGAPGAGRLAEPQIEALSLAMALAPGVYARNRMFAFFQDEGVRRARQRAATLRGVARQLGRAGDVELVAREPSSFQLRYGIEDLRLTRVVELSRVELCALRVMCERAGVTALPCAPDDRACVDAALARLLDDPTAGPLSEAARDSVVPPADA